KLIKAEGTKLSDIKTAVSLEAQDGEAELKADIEAQLRVARWMGAPVGTQFSFLDEGMPAGGMAYDEGKRAGLRADDRSSVPHPAGTPQYDRWFDGYDAGQAVNLSKIQQSREDDARAFDAAGE